MQGIGGVFIYGLTKNYRERNFRSVKTNAAMERMAPTGRSHTIRYAGIKPPLSTVGVTVDCASAGATAQTQKRATDVAIRA